MKSFRKYTLALVVMLAPLLTQAKVIVVPPVGDSLYNVLGAVQPGDILYLKNGIYNRLNDRGFFWLRKNDITIIGGSREGVFITMEQDVAGNEDTLGDMGDGTGRTFNASCRGLYMEDLTIENRALIAQSVALRSDGDSIVLNHCRLLSHQDTHYAGTARQYLYNCEIRGDVDFIYGNAAVMYDSSMVYSRKRKGGYITAPAEAKMRTGDFKHGTLIKNSVLRGEEGRRPNDKCYLGRPWKADNSSVFFKCRIDSHIMPAGWAEWNGTENDRTYMAEYKSCDLQGNLLDVSSRVSWSSQVPDSDSSKYEIPFFFKGWNPRIKTHSALLDAP